MENSDKKVLAIITFFLVLISATFLSVDKNLSLEAFKGPLYFWMRVPMLFILLGVSAVLISSVLFKRSIGNKQYFVLTVVSFATFITKLALPYYLLDGLVNYGIFTHYLNIQMLATNGIQLSEYLYWPSSFLLTSIFEHTSSFVFPLSIGLLAIISQICLAFSLFLLVRGLFGRRESVLTVLLLIIIAPFSIHWSPFTLTLSIMFLAFTLFFFGIFRNAKHFKILGFILGLSSILYHPYLPLIFVGMVISGCTCLALISRFSSFRFHYSFQAYIVPIVICSISWWFYVAVFVPAVLKKSLYGTLLGEETILVPPSIAAAHGEIVQQLQVTSFLGILSLLLIILPIVPVLFSAISKLRKHLLILKQIKILFLITPIVIMGLAYAFLTFILPLGFGERFFWIAQLLLMALAAVCIIELVDRKRIKVLSVLLAIICIFLVIMSPITNRSDYGIFYRVSMTDADVRMSSFVLSYYSPGICVTGDLRFSEILDSMQWPNSIKISSEFLDLVTSGTFKHSSDLIVVSPSTANYLVTQGVNDTSSMNYISSLPNHADILYNNGFDTIYGR